MLLITEKSSETAWAGVRDRPQRNFECVANKDLAELVAAASNHDSGAHDGINKRKLTVDATNGDTRVAAHDVSVRVDR